jgi:hypothetical protein
MSWLDPTLSLSAEASREWDRHQAARLHRDQLCPLVDRLICNHYHHEVIIQQALKRITQLEVELMLAQSTPAAPGPAPRHLQWAKELLRGGRP